MRSRTTTLRPQPWPWNGRARVLIEHPGEARGLAYASTLRQAGYAVAVCPGPEPREQCPLVGQQDCAIVDGTDLIFSSLGLESLPAREVVQALKVNHPGTPVVVEVAPGDAEKWGAVLEGCIVVTSPVAPEDLRAVVASALAGARAGGRT